ncbi:uncharacterized protein VTP21DRAFT_7010 [Calcarisporiella thermophila]|uniref:uncharacterized protein n=1 Tax=Calcarisporiella thermophila TaxID=911321 RepID=UPI003742B290
MADGQLNLKDPRAVALCALQAIRASSLPLLAPLLAKAIRQRLFFLRPKEDSDFAAHVQLNPDRAPEIIRDLPAEVELKGPKEVNVDVETKQARFEIGGCCLILVWEEGVQETGEDGEWKYWDVREGGFEVTNPTAKNAAVSEDEEEDDSYWSRYLNNVEGHTSEPSRREPDPDDEDSYWDQYDTTAADTGVDKSRDALNESSEYTIAEVDVVPGRISPQHDSQHNGNRREAETEAEAEADEDNEPSPEALAELSSLLKRTLGSKNQPYDPTAAQPSYTNINTMHHLLADFDKRLDNRLEHQRDAIRPLLIQGVRSLVSMALLYGMEREDIRELLMRVCDE